MKVIITGSESPEAWYVNKIGKEFEVGKTAYTLCDELVYSVISSIFKYQGYYIAKKDCEIVKEEK